MDPFTLIIWIFMGQRLEETRMLNLGRGECVERKIAIEADRGSRFVRGQCIGAGGYILPMDRPPPRCAPCFELPPPGRGRV